MGSSFGVYQRAPISIKVWFHPDVAGHIKEKIWHASQQINPQPDGSIIFEAEVAGTDKIRFWIMTWSSKTEVLELGSLRKEIRAEAGRMATQHEGCFNAGKIFPTGQTDSSRLEKAKIILFRKVA